MPSLNLRGLLGAIAGWRPAASVPELLATAAPALRAAGATRLAARARGVRGAVAAEIAPGAPAGTGLVAVVVVVEAEGSGRTGLRLEGADGAVLDAVPCPPGAGRWEIALFAPPVALVRVVGETLAGAAEPRIAGCGAFALDAAALAPGRLIPQVELAPDAGWGRVYGHPEGRDAAARLRERAFAMLAAPVAVPWLEGLEVTLEPGDELSRALLISGLYEPETMVAVRGLLPEGGVFVDVGAHCGLFSLFAARRAGRVLAFEPSPREFARLEGHIAQNRLGNVTPRRAAVAEAAGMVTLRLAEAGHAGHNTIGSGFAYAGVAVAEMAEVEAVTLDAALAFLDRCDVIKMDIEGAELRALRGGATTIARLRPALVLEVFDAALAGHGNTVAELTGWLEAAGYVAHDIDPATARLVAPAEVRPGESKNIVALPKG